MGIYGILWVLELKVNTYYLGTIIVLVIMKIDTSSKKWEQTKKPIVIF